jgi:hypothetical protein
VGRSSVKLSVKAILGFGCLRLAASQAAEAVVLALCTTAPRPMGRPRAILGHASQAVPGTVGPGQLTVLQSACWATRGFQPSGLGFK